MIKLIISDLDGCLSDSREIHFKAFVTAVKEISNIDISQEEHDAKFDALSTKQKVKILSSDYGLREELQKKIIDRKNVLTEKMLSDSVKYDERLCSVFAKLKEEGYIIYVSSNAIRETVKTILIQTGLIKYVDYFFGNQDATKNKPSPESYIRCMLHANVEPYETLIIEDSHHGKNAAITSGAFICPVDNPEQLTYEKIKLTISNSKKQNVKWKADNLNVLIPMGGIGSRFSNAGYKMPKPLIDVNGAPMIQRVIENLNIEANYIYIVQKDHCEKYNLKTILNLLTPNCKFVEIEGDQTTKGAASSALLTKEYINNDDHLLIANCDQIVDWVSGEFMFSMLNYDGGILSFIEPDLNPKWSYVKVNSSNLVVELAEKKPISNNATVGIYYYNKGSEFIKYTEQMIQANDRVNNEFYIAPVYNYFIKDNKRIKNYICDKMYGIGTPEDLNNYLKLNK